MSDLAAFERDPYLTQWTATVLETGMEAGRPFAVLDDSLFYPEGGGQPADQGLLGGVAVLDVQKRADRVHHYLAAPVPLGPVTLSLDWARRFDHMQQHTGQHLITAVAQDRFGWATTSFHLGPDLCDVELAVPALDEAELARLEAAVAEEIRAARSVTFRRVSLEAYAGLQVRSRGLPAGFRGEVRLVEIQGLDLNTCGGTHVRSTAELETIKLVGCEALRGGTRVFFVAGGRVRRRLGEAERRHGALRGLLGAPDDGLVAAVEAKLDQLKGLERRVRGLEEELSEGLAAALAELPDLLVERHCEGKEAGFLQRAARQLTAAAPGKTALLTASLGGQAWFLLCAGDASATDVPALGRSVAALLGGKGGGAGKLFQGKAGSLEARAAAVELLRSALGG